MANEYGAEKLTERILTEARQDAQAALRQAEAEAEQILAAARAEAEAIRKAAESKADRLREETLERYRTNAKLEARKEALADKRAVMEEAFDLAETRLESMAGAERARVLTGLLLRECQGGETILPAPKDAEGMESLLRAVNENFAADGRAALNQGPVEPGIAGGFLVRAQGYEKNCSFAALMKELRETRQTEVADILFS